MIISFFKQPPMVVAAGIITLVSLWLSFVVFGHTNKLEVVFLDVGQGDATLITTPHGRQVLIDAGVDTTIGRSLAKHMPSSDRSLDIVIMTHPDLDHVGGMMPLLQRYDVKSIIHSGLLAGSPLYQAVAETINNQKVETISAHAGQRIFLDKDVYIDVLSPHQNLQSLEPNEYSVVVRLVHGDTSMLLMGDATKFNEQEILGTFGDLIDSDILKVGHHGSQTSSSFNFIKTVSPEYSVVSAGCNNRFGHPHASVLATLFGVQSQVLDTCNDGDIIFQSDGKNWIKK